MWGFGVKLGSVRFCAGGLRGWVDQFGRVGAMYPSTWIDSTY